MIPWVLLNIGSDLWSKYIMVFTGNRHMSVTHFSHKSARENIDSKAIFISNHVSQLDINAASLAIPHPIVFLAKESVRKVPILGWLNERVGTVFINRKNSESSRKAVYKLKETLGIGISVLVFPEGTRSKNGEIANFKKGAFHLAIEADVPVIPLHIYGTRKALPSGAIWVKANPIHVRFGDPIYPADCDHDAHQMTQVSQASVMQLKKWHTDHISSPD
jgi:1-acyl-sn-glycerol-3-phosphate acyltransferase